MQEKESTVPQPQASSERRGPYGRALMAVTTWFAYIGGLVFIALVVMSVVSIVGRKLFSAPVPGDVEVLQMASAFASATFFAYCHMTRGDVKVDFFTAWWSDSTLHQLDAVGSLLVGLFGSLMTWRSGAGVISLYQSGETSMVLGWPVWVAQALMLPGFLLLGLAGFYMTGWHWRTSRRVRKNGVLA